MANLPWVDELQKRLRRHALPPTYVQRFVEELNDHLQDIKEEDMSTEADVFSRLGAPQQVAEAAITAYKRRSVIGRHPAAAFLVFAVSPILSLIALSMLILVGLVLLNGICSWLGFKILDAKPIGELGSIIINYLMSSLIIITPAIIANVLYCKIAKGLSLGRKWMCVSCVMIAVTASLAFIQVKFSSVPGNNVLTLGIGIPWLNGWIPSFSQILQFIVPLGIGCWFMRNKRDHGQQLFAC
ncbi:MAG: hypothetical protein ABSE63_06700 [Thermoguttaceae bacterium]|jgi:uncharacterized membrane protein